jgi:hypothetical protein
MALAQQVASAHRLLHAVRVARQHAEAGDALELLGGEMAELCCGGCLEFPPERRRPDRRVRSRRIECLPWRSFRTSQVLGGVGVERSSRANRERWLVRLSKARPTRGSSRRRLA